MRRADWGRRQTRGLTRGSRVRRRTAFLYRGGRVDKPPSVRAVPARVAQIVRGILQHLPHRGRPVHAVRNHQRSDAGHVGSGHGSSLEEVVAEVVDRAAESLLQNSVGIPVAVLIHGHVAARRHERQILTVIGVVTQGLVETSRANRDHVAVRRRVPDRGAAVIACRGHDRHSHPIGVLHCVQQSLRRGRAAQAHVDHLSSVVGGEGDAAGYRGITAASTGGENLHGHDRRAESDAGRA